jgi:hypothetical protein
MFNPSFFSPQHFTPRYFPPDFTDIIVRVRKGGGPREEVFISFDAEDFDSYMMKLLVVIVEVINGQS